MTIASYQPSDVSIALVDDDKVLTEMLAEYLQQQGFTVHCYADGEQALAAITVNGQYQAIVLDIMMPRINGLDMLQQLRQSIQTPVIMVTGRGDDIDKILGLELGADDYLAKPCNPRELLARINAILRRRFIQESALHSVDPPEKVSPQLTVGVVTINRASREVKVAGQTLQLTSVEFSVLLHLMDAAGTVVSKEEISRKVLHRELSAYDRSIDVHVSRIRKKLEALQQQPSAIKTLRGQGYLFADETS